MSASGINSLIIYNSCIKVLFFSSFCHAQTGEKSCTNIKDSRELATARFRYAFPGPNVNKMDAELSKQFYKIGYICNLVHHDVNETLTVIDILKDIPCNYIDGQTSAQKRQCCNVLSDILNAGQITDQQIKSPSINNIKQVDYFTSDH